MSKETSDFVTPPPPKNYKISSAFSYNFISALTPLPVTGKIYGSDCLGRLHKTLLKKAGITENVTLHGLRHTFATFAIQNGVDAKTVSSILGHYSAGFTLDTYAHVTSEMQREAAQKMGSFMAQTV